MEKFRNHPQPTQDRICHVAADLLLAEQTKDWLLEEKRDGLLGLHVLSAWAFRASAFCVRHPLAFMQGVEFDSLQALRVKKQILFAIRANESKTPVRQLLDSAFGHLYFSERLPGLTLLGKQCRLPSSRWMKCSDYRANTQLG